MNQSRTDRAPMRQFSPRMGTWLASPVIVPLSCALVVIGAKCLMIARYGNPTPFWDQWDAEGAVLYPHYFGGTLTLGDLIAPHNEHRILVTRLWSLLLLELAGYWDPILQMLANTLWLAGVVALLIAAVSPLLDRLSLFGFALFTTAAFALPLDWANTLSGFNSQWYFMELLGLAGLLALVAAPAFTLRWWSAISLFLLGYLSMAGGAATVAAAFAICALQVAVRRRSGSGELIALAILAAMTAAMVHYTPTPEQNAAMRTHSVGQFVRAFLEVASWPPTSGQPIPVLILCAIPIQAPALLGSLFVLRQRPPLADRRWFLVAMVGWSLLQMAILAYGRGGSTESRYVDVLLVGLLASDICLLWAWRATQQWRRKLVIGVAAFWLALIFSGFGTKIVKDALPQARDSYRSGQAQTRNLRAYLATGDIAALGSKPVLQIPFRDPQELAKIVSIPSVRAILPPVLVGEASAARAQQRGLAQWTGRGIEAIKALALGWGILLMPLGLMLLAVWMIAQRLSRSLGTDDAR
jgi:hypothetical protein